ncbi:IS21 family transposase [Pseudoalteromonas maricaloris]|uniref:IS21 family transposase n=1 Tax=Pseudoalteromonas maricaloris TaxID=184924 RepID=UPI00029A8F89|nr:IS21 family transposase [Pseudoalteromonas flavipulchra]
MSIVKLRRLLRLLIITNYSNRRIAVIVSVSPNTVKFYRKKLMARTISVEQLNKVNDSQLKSLFIQSTKHSSEKRAPDWSFIHQLMQQKHQTLIQLWEEYRSISPDDAYSYSQFTHYYRRYCKSIDVSMRQYYQPGEICFVDFAGKRIPWFDKETLEEQWAEIYVGVLGYSQLIFAVAVRSQKLEDWLEAHQKMLAFYGGVPQVIVPDNLKSAVTTPGRFPDINHSYHELSEHYGFTIEPARVRRPQDKSLAEIGVLLVTRWITVVLKRRKFFSIAEINQAMIVLLEQLNRRAFKRYEGNRESRFEECEKGKLNPLPTEPLEIGRWIHHQHVTRDYHIYVLGHAYSVPYELINQYVDVKVCQSKVEIHFEHTLIAVHIRSFAKGGATTENSHRPKNHQVYAQQSKEHFIQWAQSIGESALALVIAQFENKPDFSINGCRASNQLQKLAKQYGNARFESACGCAVKIKSMTVSSVRSILQCHLDESSHKELPVQIQLPLHHNVRGAEYYFNGGQVNE